MDGLYLPEFFNENRGRSHGTTSIGTDDFGLWLFDDEDESFKRALHALNNTNDVFNDITDNELDNSTSCASEDLDASLSATMDTRRSMMFKRPNNASEMQLKMNAEVSMHISQMDFSNPLMNVFDGMEHTSLLLENELQSSKRLRMDNNSDYGHCLPVGNVPQNAASTKRCEEPGCFKFPQGSTRFCISHGGGRRCTFENCTKGARDRYFCAAHGGGRRCGAENCAKSAVGGSNMCATHGGGRKCGIDGCSKSAQSPTPFCVMHGGGKKCTKAGCTKVARGKTSFCAAHGGGVRCETHGCGRAALAKHKHCRTHLTASEESEDFRKDSPISDD
jgi:hypothetical protein